MLSRRLKLRGVMGIAVLATALAAPNLALAQVGAGVVIDASGVVQLKSAADQSGRLGKRQQAAARAGLNTLAAKPSALRYISLKHLEQAIRDKNGAITDEMRYLAGMLRVHYVFLYPDSGDIVIAGPAEGWTTDADGRAIGISSGRPVIRLEDLCVALRAFPPSGDSAKFIGCSIDPTQEGQAAYNRFVQSVGSFDPRDNQRIEAVAEGMRKSKGLQTVTVSGVSPKTHFAVVMVEADYRMKLIGIGLEKPPVKLKSFVDRADATQLGREGLLKWFFTPNYECVRTSNDNRAMELVGNGVKLVMEAELVSAGGESAVSGRTNNASRAFTEDFTKVYPELADKAPVYAELRNLIDLSVMAAYIKQHDFYAKANWKMDVLGDEYTIATETWNAPKQIPTVVNIIRKAGQLCMPNGGVEISPLTALDKDKILADKDSKVSQAREKVKIDLAKGRWWWD